MNRHDCTLPWCANGGSSDADHFQSSDYVAGVLPLPREVDHQGAVVPTVTANALTVDGTPGVGLHIGGPDDADAQLTVTDARRLLEILTEAITNAETLSEAR